MTKVLGLIFISIIMAACSPKAEQTRIKISLGNIGTIPQFTGGFVLWGKHESGKKISIALPAGQVEIGTIEIELGAWELYAFGWDNQVPMSGAAMCDHVSQTFLTEQEEVTLNLSTINCDRADITEPTFKIGNNLQPIELVSCNDINGASAAANCDGVLKGNWKSYKISIPTLEGSGFGNLDSELTSSCIDETTPGLISSTLTSLNLPVLEHADNPAVYKIEVFESIGCQETAPHQMLFIGNGFSAHPQTQVFSSGSVSKIFIKSPLAYDGPVNLMALSNFRSENFTATTVDIVLDFLGDSNVDTNLSTIINYCAHTGGGCSPLTPIALTRYSTTLSATLTGLTQGDIIEFDIQASGFDPDGQDLTGIVSLTPQIAMPLNQLTSVIVSSPGVYGNTLTPTITVAGAASNASIEYFYNDVNCLTNSLGAGSPTSFSFPLVSPLPGVEASYTIYAVQHQGAFKSPCSSVSATYTYDVTVPTVTTDALVDANLANYTSFPISGACSENGQLVFYNIDTGTVTGSTTCSTLTWNATANISAIGDSGGISITADHDDLAGNSASQASTTINKDIIAPAVTLTDVEPSTTASASWTVTATFSELVTGLTIADFVTGNGSLSSFAGGPSVYTMTLTPSGAGPVTVDLAASKALDIVGNNSTEAAQLSTTYSPGADFIVTMDHEAGQLPITNNASINFSVIFAEPIDPTSFTISDITESGTATNSGWVVTHNSGNTDFTISTTATSDGTIVPNLTTGTIDNAGKTYVNLTPTLTNNIVTYDGTLPVVSGVTPPGNAIYKIGDVLTFTMNFTESVDITGTPRIPITLTSGTVYAVYSGGTGSANINFQYTVAPSDFDIDGIVLTSPFELNAGNIEDLALNVPSLVYAPPSTSSIFIDGILPSPPTIDIANGQLFQGSLNINFSGSTDNLALDNYYYTTNGSSPSCGSTVGATHTINPVSHGFQTTIRVVACDTAGNASTETNYMYTELDPTIDAFYTNAQNWGDYADPPFNTRGTAACPGGVKCKHGGEARIVELNNVLACGSLNLTDNLGIFKWRCDQTSFAHVVFLSDGFEPGMGLKDLVNLTSWKSLNVTLTGSEVNSVIESTPSTTVWTNTVSQIPSTSADTTSILNTPSMIYTNSTTNKLTDGYSIEADKISIVSLGAGSFKAAATMTSFNCNGVSGGTGAPDNYCMFISKNQDYLWFESDMDGLDGSANVTTIMHLHTVENSKIYNSHIFRAENEGIYLKGSTYNTLSNLKVDEIYDYSAAKPSDGTAGSCIALDLGSDNNALINIDTGNCFYAGLDILTSSNNTIINFKGFGHSQAGIKVVTNANDNKFHQVLIGQTHSGSNSEGYGIYLEASKNNIFSNITSVSNEYGIYSFNGDNNLYKDITTNNNENDGIYLNSGSDQNSIINAVSVNNDYGIDLFGSTGNTILNFTATNNATDNVWMDADNKFTGFLKLGFAGSSDCTTTGVGLVNGSCANANSSDASLTQIVNASSGVFKGDLGSMSFGTLNGDFFMSLIGPYQSYGHSTSGACITGSCAKNDWSLKNIDTILRNIYSPPSGNDTYIHSFFGGGSVSFLPRAREISKLEHLPIINQTGNENFLCESNESCSLIKNNGSYQGELSSMGTDPGFNIPGGGTVINVEMWSLGINGVSP